MEEGSKKSERVREQHKMVMEELERSYAATKESLDVANATNKQLEVRLEYYFDSDKNV